MKAQLVQKLREPRHPKLRQRFELQKNAYCLVLSINEGKPMNKGSFRFGVMGTLQSMESNGIGDLQK